MSDAPPRVGERRVHVVPLGYEHDRIVEPIRRTGADVVYLLADDPDRTADRGQVDFTAVRAGVADGPVAWDRRSDYQRDARAALTELAAVRDVPVRFGDTYDVLGVVTTIAAAHGVGRPDGATGDRLFVNVSTGPAVAVVGAAIACMAVGARPYAVEPATHRHDLDAEPLTAGVERVTDLPIYPIDAPSRDQVAVLGYLHDRASDDRTTDKWNVITWADDRGLEFLHDVGDSRTAKYRALESRVLDPLRDQGYVSLVSVGRSDDVRLTDRGRRVHFAFQHELNDSPDDI